MDNRIRKMRESVGEYLESKVYFFHFENADGHEIATVIWFVYPNRNKQSLVLRMDGGEPLQLMRLFTTYFSAKQFAERFDLDMVTFLFEQFSENEDIEIICD